MERHLRTTVSLQRHNALALIEYSLQMPITKSIHTITTSIYIWVFSGFAYLVALLPTAQGDPASSTAELPVIPGGEGFGIHTPAGRGGTIYKVTSLDSKGPGTLLACLTARGPRVCVFEVGGEISYDKDVIIRHPFLTVAGQTAPAPGITIRDAGLRIATHDVLIQHIRIRLGTKNRHNVSGIALSLRGKSHGSTNTSNIVVDHVSLSWAWNKLFGTWSSGVHDVTVSNSILSEALHRSIHPKGPHSTAMLIGPHHERVAITANLFAHNNHRTPYLKGRSSSTVVNNLIYNSAWQAMQLEDVEGFGTIKASIVGNQVIPGPDSQKRLPLLQIKRDVRSADVYLNDNIHPLASNNPWDSIVENVFLIPIKSERPPVDISGITIRPANTIATWVLANAGARPAERDAVDARIVNEVATHTGRRIDCVAPSESDCSINGGGWPDNAPSSRTLDIPDNPHEDKDGNGYTRLEEWLHALSARVEPPGQ